VKKLRSRARLADGACRRRGHHAEGAGGKLEPGDIVIDGGNSYYIDDIRRAKELAAKSLPTSM